MYKYSGFAIYVSLSVTPLCIVSTYVNAKEEVTINKKLESYSVSLGRTRVIYDPSSEGSVLLVNNPNDYPVLVQSKVYLEDKKTVAPFLITPPLFRLDGRQQSRLQIIKTDETFDNDKESLNWLCVTGIPPEAGDEWARNGNSGGKPKKEALLNIKVKLSRCIKLFVRPSTLTDNPVDVAQKITWASQGKKIVAKNPTPFYINFSSLFINGNEIKQPNYIKPFSSQEYTTTSISKGDVTWSLITDLGGESKKFLSKVE